MLTFKKEGLQQLRLTEDLEKFLGDPRNPSNVCSYKSVVALDEADQFPDDMAMTLTDWGLYQYFVPSQYGGRLVNFDEFMLLFQTIYRRDPTLGLGYGLTTFMAAVVVWVAGSQEQKSRLSDIIMLRKKPVSVAYHETAHGNDFLNIDCHATRDDRGFLIQGNKWLINNAQYGDALTLFARTGTSKSARDCSLFFLDKQQLDFRKISYADKIRTLGVRGCRIAGIEFTGCHVDEGALIGQEGEGAEISFRAFQVTRTILPGISLGAADTALRTVVRFSLERRLYGDTVFRIPHARGTLADAFIDLLTCECVSIAASRYLHVMTEQMSVYSAVVKYFVPTKIERTLQRLSVILGARHYLREGFEWGIFQKIMRDYPVVSAGHASTIICLSTLSAQLRQLATHRTRHKEVDGHVAERLRAVFDLSCPLPPFDAGRLVISNRGRDDVAEGLVLAFQELRGLESDSTIESDVVSQLVNLTQAFIDARALYERAIQASRTPANHADSRYFQHEEAYCTVHVATACLQIWLHNRLALGEFFARGHWLVLCLMRLLDTLGHSSGTMPPEYVEEAAEELVRLFNENHLFSILPVRLGATEETTLSTPSPKLHFNNLE
jgi:alkylation response protein AidB-like acyl-CoA dehydrogenase